jgi:hypothetical protein
VIALKRIQKLPNTVTIEQSTSSHASKLVGRILRGRIEKKIGDLLGQNQFGFRGGKGTRNAIGMLRIMSE